MDKLTFQEFIGKMQRHNFRRNITYQFDKKAMVGCIVFAQSNFDKPYSEKSRTYRVTSANKYFLTSMGGSSLFGDCLDGSENGVRLDWYMSGRKPWKVDYCYIPEQK